MEPRDPAGDGRQRAPGIDDFLGEPTRDLADWRWLWSGDRAFPIRSHRGVWGRLLVAWKRLLRPLFKTPLNDLFERQQVFNLILLERLQKLDELSREYAERLAALEKRAAYIQELNARGLHELTTHHDALFALLDQKLDRYRRRTELYNQSLGAAVALAEQGKPAALAERQREVAYVALEERHRGSEPEIAERLRGYLPYLEGRGEVLDLGCGRGELLALLAERRIAARGVDGSREMVAHCRQLGLRAEQGDLFEALAGAPAESLGAVVSFHVIEHLPAEDLDRLVRLAWRVLRPGGVLVLETPNPLSLVVGARNFWLDPTHRRPVHPESLELAYELAGFDPVERLDLRPFAEEERLPELDLADFPAEQRELADRVNRLRDRLDDLLFGFQDFALVGVKPGA